MPVCLGLRGRVDSWTEVAGNSGRHVSVDSRSGFSMQKDPGGRGPPAARIWCRACLPEGRLGVMVELTANGMGCPLIAWRP